MLVDGWGGPSQGATVAAARAAGIPVMLDAGSVRDDVLALLDQSDVVIGSEPFARELTGADDPRAALRLLLERGARMAAVTRGERGVVAATAGGVFEVPAHPVRAVDTTGAGDAFHGGAAWALAAGHDFETALRIGAVVAALKCRTPGARAGLPGREAVETALGASLTPPRIHP
ncbi:MAG: hypothetical protein KC591_13540 [Gemmatimonadetes bacterium]|nr:hypothetical protein [Gemmatimonadota bacterium]